MQDPITTPDYQDKKRGQYTPDTDNKATQWSNASPFKFDFWKINSFCQHYNTI